MSANGETQVGIIRTGTANIASVTVGLQRLGATVRMVETARDVEQAPALVLPGVGAFAAAMGCMSETPGLIGSIQDRIRSGRPTLCICLGLQLLATCSEEDPGACGLGIIEGCVTRFDGNTVRVPHIGWNSVQPADDCDLLHSGYAYFANSYRLTAAPSGWSCAMADHDGPFIAAIERGAVLGCQFHPELSGQWGQMLLRRWLNRAFELDQQDTRTEPCSC